jgi:uncharacterized membrane protein YsdA (DUF1294 family)
MRWILYALLAMNAAGFAVTGWDKRCARSGARRVSERALFLWALLGGSLGVYAGMLAFRHKTQKWYFKYGVPAIVLVQIALGLKLLAKLPLFV